MSRMGRLGTKYISGHLWLEFYWLLKGMRLGAEVILTHRGGACAAWKKQKRNGSAIGKNRIRGPGTPLS